MRYHEILDAKSPLTDREAFSFLNVSDNYRSFRKLSKKQGEKSAFRDATGLPYGDLLRARRPGEVDAANVFRILDITRLCCMRTVSAAPVWPDYNTTKPPGSAIELDVGQVKRYVQRSGMKFDSGEITEDEFVVTGGMIQGEVEFTVGDDELEALSV